MGIVIEKAIIFGAGVTGQTAVNKLKNHYSLLCFWDNNPKLLGTYFLDIPTHAPGSLAPGSYDAVYVCTTSGMDEAVQQLLDLGVPHSKIHCDFVLTRIRARENFLYNMAQMLMTVPGNVAEAGVFRGQFACLINEAFPNRKLYLFDTFTGFVQQDIEEEGSADLSAFAKDCSFANTNVDMVKNRLPHPENAVFRVGFFPDSAEGIDDTFCFVNLDMDLYNPTYQALCFFVDKMAPGGVILLHDYYGEAFPNVKKAVFDYEQVANRPLIKLPIGDDCSTAIVIAR